MKLTALSNQQTTVSFMLHCF